MQLKTKLFFIFLSCATGSFGQDISGTWEGNYTWNLLMTHPNKVVTEIFIHDDSLISGATHLYYSGGKYEHYKTSGVYHKEDSTVYFSEDSTISVWLGSLVDNCLGNYTMKLTVTDTSWRLKGKWRDNDRSLLHCPGTGVWFEKKLPRKEQPVVKEKDRNLTRAADIQKIIELDHSEKDSVQIEVYDNAQIDGDVISIYLNDSTIVNRHRLTADHLIFYVSVSKNEPLVKIQMAAESMGSIPPCTTHMIVATRLNRYEVDLSSSYSNNGIIELFLKE